MILQLDCELIVRYRERLWSQPAHALRYLSAPFQAAEHSYVIVDERGIVEGENRASVRGSIGVEQQLAGHAEMDDQDAAIEAQNDVLAVPADFEYFSSGESI